MENKKYNNKQTGGKVMKTKNNVQKTTLNGIAIIFSLVILSVTVDAQGIWKSFMEYSNYNEKELVMASNNETDVIEYEMISTGNNSFEMYFETATEESLDLEDWMTNETYFSTTTVAKQEIEFPLELEAWMTDASLFAANTMYLETETENALELEDWMTDYNYFNESAYKTVELSEAALELEDWMVDERNFQVDENNDQPLEVESWMVAENYWNN